MENRKRLEVRGKGWVMGGFRVVEGKIVFTYIRKKRWRKGLNLVARRRPVTLTVKYKT